MILTPGGRWLSAAVQAWTIPILILVSTVIGLAIGRVIDHTYKTEPWFSILLTLLGLVAGIYESVRILVRISRGNNY
ncbi:MAG: AtpZ/AtpI family protein [Armatimonadota bacterium]